MSDSTVAEADPAAVQAVADAVLAGAGDDPLDRYQALTAAQSLYTEAALRIKALRAAELRRMSEGGASGTQIAAATGLGTRQRVSQVMNLTAKNKTS